MLADRNPILVILIDIDDFKNINEKYDGTGYPFGHEKEKNSISRRILAIVDSYSAMTVRRVYRKQQLSRDEALQELILQKGCQFDAELVDQFVTLFK